MRAFIYSLFSSLLFVFCANAQPNLTWGSYFGGSGFDNPVNIETDHNGNVYVCGATVSSNFPLLSGNQHFQGTGLAIDYGYLSKFSPSGKLLWSIPYADSTDYTSTLILDLAIDKNNNVFLCGHSNGSALPLLSNSTYFQQFNGGAQDAFIIKFDSAGTILWATYFGGDRNDWGYSICLNDSGDVYLAGITTSSVFPLLNSGGYFNSTADTNGCSYIARFDNNGTLLWSTLYHHFSPWGTTIDTSQNLIITGQAFAGMATQSVTGGYFQPVCAGLDDAAILKFDPGDNRSWATFFGGTSSDRAYSVLADKAGSFFLLGHTSSTNIPVQNSGGYYKPNLTGSGDVFLAKFTSASVLAWSTYYGGSANEAVNAFDNFELDACGNLYVGIDTYSADMPWKINCSPGYIDSTLSGVADHFICRFSPAHAQQWATYIGGTQFDYRTMIDVNIDGNIFMAGIWNGNSLSGLPLVNPGLPAYYDATPNGLNDVGLVRFSNPLFKPSFSYPAASCSQSGTVGIVNAQLLPLGSFSSSPGLILNATTGAINALASSPGSYTITYSANQPSTACTCTVAPQSVTTATYMVSMQPSVVVSGNTVICQSAVVTLTASGALNYLWSNGSQLSTFTASPAFTTTYNVIGYFGGCTDTTKIIVIVTLCTNLSNAGIDASSLICYNSGPGELSLKKNKRTKVLVYDLSGRVLKQIELNGSAETVIIPDLLPGIYLLRDEEDGQIIKVAVN